MKITLQIVVSISVVFLLCATLTQTSAKYVTVSEFDANSVSIQNFFEEINNTSLTYYSPLDNGITTDGYYAVILKGGDGGPGIESSGDNYLNVIPGGLGGIVTGYIYLKSTDTLNIYLGGAGGYPTLSGSNGVVGTGGRNSYNNRGYGGNGGKVPTMVFFTDMNKQPASAGGGAASYICLNGTLTSDIVFIAGGGGGGGSWNSGYGGFAVTSGAGGAGGSNVQIPSTYNSTYISTNISTANSGRVYSGENGIDPVRTEGTLRYGSGATVTPGSGGSDGSYPGGAGSAAWTGTGGNAAKNGGSSLGGAGGGGYTGGGGGGGSSQTNSAGGGGGGSSYVKSIVNSVTTNSLPQSLYTYMINDRSTIYRSTYMSNRMSGSYTSSWLNVDYRHGFIMILYLGSDSSIPTILSNMS